jgi:hypothetical protein
VGGNGHYEYVEIPEAADAMRTYEVVGMTHSGKEFRYTAVTSGGELKAAYMAGSAFGDKHPRTGIATFRVELVSDRGKLRTDDLVDRMEW